MSITDYTNNGECSKCGACCSNYLPMTRKEVKRLRKWAKKHHFKPDVVDNALDFTCPFLDKGALTCVCYEIRPEICRRFSCHQPTYDAETRKGIAENLHIYSVRSELFNDSSLPPYRDAMLLLDYVKKANSNNGGH